MGQLRSLDVGLEIEKLDLRNYFGKPSDLKPKLLTFGTIWFCGGNAFVLRQAMQLSGFDDIIRQFSRLKYRYALRRIQRWSLHTGAYP